MRRRWRLKSFARVVTVGEMKLAPRYVAACNCNCDNSRVACLIIVESWPEIVIVKRDSKEGERAVESV